MKKVICALSLSVLVGASAHAEGVVTKDNVVIEGRILKETDSAVLVEHIGMGAISVPCTQIKYVLIKGALIEDAERAVREEDRARRIAEDNARRKATATEPKKEWPEIKPDAKDAKKESGAPKPLPLPTPTAPAAPGTPVTPAPANLPAPAAPAVPAPIKAVPAAPAVPAPAAGPVAKPPAPPAAVLKKNEAGAVASCKAFVEAQERYHGKDWDGDKILEYAQALNGDLSLFETKAGAGDIRLIDQAFALAEGNPAAGAPSKNGYRFKVLTGQGDTAFGGAKSYVMTENGKPKMTLGYALVAYPAEYTQTGISTFSISIAGVIFKKDLGAQTAELVRAMNTFNPDKTWVQVEQL